jgi:uncharacterized protein YihD (DUF1040 family)
MIIIPAILESYRSLKDKTIKLVFDTNELTPEQMMGVAGSLQQFGYLAFKSEPFKNNEKEVIENLKSDYEDTGKTPSQRLRGVLFVNWQQSSEGYKTFVDYYAAKMEIIINHYKGKLD